MLLKTLAVRRAIAALPTHGGAHDEWHTHLLVVHVAKLGGMIQPLIKGESEKIAEHDLTHRQPALQRQATTQPHQRRLTDWHVAHPPRKRRAEGFGDLKSTAIRPFDILAKQDNTVMLLHVALQSCVEQVHKMLGSGDTGGLPLWWRQCRDLVGAMAGSSIWRCISAGHGSVDTCLMMNSELRHDFRIALLQKEHQRIFL